MSEQRLGVHQVMDACGQRWRRFCHGAICSDVTNIVEWVMKFVSPRPPFDAYASVVARRKGFLFGQPLTGPAILAGVILQKRQWREENWRVG